jgi:hypothetical protein
MAKQKIIMNTTTRQKGQRFGGTADSLIGRGNPGTTKVVYNIRSRQIKRS